MPGPEDVAVGILGRDNGIAVFQHLGSGKGYEAGISGIIGNFCDDIAGFRRLGGSKRFPQNLCLGNSAYGSRRIAHNGLEGIYSG